MPRRKQAAKRKILVDSRYKSELISKFINHIMVSGKKSAAEKIVYGALDKLGESIKGDPLEILEKALNNVRPAVEVRSRRVGGATYQIPIEVRPVRRTTLALRWIISASRGRSEHSMVQRLFKELSEAFDGRGAAVKIKQDKEKMAQANQAFANYRW